MKILFKNNTNFTVVISFIGCNNKKINSKSQDYILSDCKGKSSEAQIDLFDNSGVIIDRWNGFLIGDSSFPIEIFYEDIEKDNKLFLIWNNCKIPSNKIQNCQKMNYNYLIFAIILLVIVLFFSLKK
jgi:hypothetical protein